MNASASTALRKDEVQSKIRKIQAFGRNARVACGGLLGIGLLTALILIITITLVPETSGGDGGVYDILTSQRAPLLFKAWMFLLMGATIGIWLAILYQLYRLFGNLATGAIYTAENVRRVRYVGLVLLLSPVVSMVVLATLVVAERLAGPAGPSGLDRLLPSFSQLLIVFLAAGLILLVSWIMDVGRYEKDQAETLRRDAELVI